MSLFKNLFSKKLISSFEKVTLRLSGMRHVTEYEIVMKDGMAEISQYGIRFSEGKDSRVAEKRAVCGEQTALKLMNDCRLLSWDGFHGPHPKGVRDGTTFILRATVNGDKTVGASGSRNFPPRFRDFTDGLRDILDGAREDQTEGTK